MIINDLDGYYIVFDTKNWNTELDTLTNKIWETHSFWGIFFDYEAIWCSFSSNYRFHLGIEMHYVWAHFKK